MLPVLRLCEDVLPNGGEMALPAHPRMVFVVHGAVTVADGILRDEGTFSAEGAAAVKAGKDGAMLWRWEFLAEPNSDRTDRAAPAPDGRGVVSREKLAAPLQTLPPGSNISTPKTKPSRNRRAIKSTPICRSGISD